jgi:hypothetical protein
MSKKRGTVFVIQTFLKVLRCLKHGTTVYEIGVVTGMGPRQIHRWLNTIEKIFGLERIPSSAQHGNWMYRVDREKIREKF